MGLLPDIQVAGDTLYSAGHGRRACTSCDSNAAIIETSLGAWEASACMAHLPSAVAAAVAELALQVEAARQGAIEADPSCWSWPLPDDSAADDPYRRMERWHDGRCAICGHSEPLVNDHDHDGGDMIRGLLCWGCNIAEGRSAMPIMRKYRERHPALILGVRVPYTNQFGRTGWMAA